jgi:hypothetical protein
VSAFQISGNLDDDETAAAIAVVLQLLRQRAAAIDPPAVTSRQVTWFRAGHSHSRVLPYAAAPQSR